VASLKKTKNMRNVRLCVLAIAAACAIPASAAFKCTDEKGRTHFGETPPDACVNVVTYELSRSGSVIRKIEPTAAKVDDSADRKKAADDEKAAAVRKRRDQVLLDSYGSEREIDAARDRNVDVLKNRLSAAKTNAQKAQQRQQEAQRLVDSKGRGTTEAMAADLARAKKDRGAADATVSHIEKDLGEIEARFAADKARWMELRAAK
jgi:hypothetical protein